MSDQQVLDYINSVEQLMAVGDELAAENKQLKAKAARLDQIIALKEAGMNPCLRDASQDCNNWNLQLSPEAGHLIDFDGTTLEDVLKEACAKYLFAKEATT